MAFEDWFKENSKWLVPALSTGVGIWIFSDGTIMSYEVPKIAAAVGVGIIWFIFQGLRKDYEVLESERANLEKDYNQLQKERVIPQQQRQEYIPPQKRVNVFEKKYG